jgi:hypothetical protein
MSVASGGRLAGGLRWASRATTGDHYIGFIVASTYIVAKMSAIAYNIADIRRAMTTRTEQVPKQILAKMELDGKGSVFTLADFYDLGGTYTVQKALQRMAIGGIVERIGRGLYLYPKYGELLKKNVPASVDEVARAIARKFSWTITPNGETALNYLGLSTQVPAVPLYYSNGPSRSYTYGKFNIQFKSRASREITGKSYKSRLVIQALKALSEDYMTKGFAEKIKLQLSDQEKLDLIKDTKNATGWIRDMSRYIAYGGDDD